MDIDLNDPTTKALFDYYGEEKKEDFEGAYVYMKYLHEFISVAFQMMGQPPIPEMADLDPAVMEKIGQRWAMIGAGSGSYETSQYHSKVVKLEDAERLVTQEVDVHINVPETVVPYKMAKDVILNNPDSIAIGTCPCRHATAESSCLPEPMEACMFLGDPYASFVTKHNPKFRKISQKEAVDLLKGFHEMGFVHAAYFKKDMGQRLYAICNCCSCCCPTVKGRSRIQESDSDFQSLTPSGYVAVVSDECTGCEECVESCLFNAISMNDDDLAVIDQDMCMGCGVCEGKCPVEAISLREEPSKSGVLNIDTLKQQAL